MKHHLYSSIKDGSFTFRRVGYTAVRHECWFY